MPTKEFVVLGGSDADLWGDIDGPIDDAWAAAVNALRPPSALAEFTQALTPVSAALHYGPGPHPDGSPQSVHAGGANPATKPRPTPGQMGFDLDTAAEDAGLRFLRVARSGKETTSSVLGGGVTESEIVTYEDGSQGVWKAVEQKREGAHGHNGHGEVGAYRLSRLLGMDIVPPTVYSTRNGVLGTSQQLIPDFIDGNKVWDHTTFLDLDLSDVEDTFVLDGLIDNPDRNPGNWGVDPTGRLWAIDHGHAQYAERDALHAMEIDAEHWEDDSGHHWERKLALRIPPVNNLYSYVRNAHFPGRMGEFRDKALPADDEYRSHAIPGHKASGEPLPSSSLSSWRVTQEKINRWRKITLADIENALIGDTPRSDQAMIERHRWVAKGLHDRLQQLVKDGYLTWR